MPNPLATREEERRRRAYARCPSDRSAAHSLRMPPRTFSAWRAARRLPPKGTGIREPLTKRECARRDRAYATSATDAEAARRLGISLSAFAQWRTSARKPPKRARGGRSLPVGEAERRWRAIRASATIAAAARAIGLAPDRLREWVRAHPTPKRNPPRG